MCLCVMNPDERAKYLKRKFRSHFHETFPESKEYGHQVLETQKLFTQFTESMKNEQQVMKRSFQDTLIFLQDKKIGLSDKCLELHRQFLTERDEQGIYSSSLITERHCCEDAYLETVVQIIKVEKILMDIQRVLEEYCYIESISEF